MNRRAAAVAIVLTGLVFSPLPAYAAPTDLTTPAPPAAPSADTQTILVTLDHAGSDPEASAQAAVATASQAVGDGRVTDVRRVTTTTVAVTLSGGVSASEADQVAAQVDDQRNVKTASTATRFYPAATDWEANLWNINAAIGKYGVAADQAWGVTTGTSVATGAGVIVGVLDSGIVSHPDLDANVIAGYDIVGADADPTDDGVGTEWHGSHVAGTIAAVKDNSGVVGVAPGAKIEPIRVLGASGGSEADVIAAIHWAIGDVGGTASNGTPLPVNPNPVQVLNLSLGGESPVCDAPLQDAINSAVSKGIPVVVAAGNTSRPLFDFSPANCANVIRVVASTYEGGPATAYSNYGTYDAPATISAPGGSGYSTQCSGSALNQCGGVLSTVTDAGASGIGGYDFMFGTSMAAPHVSGVLALLRSIHPDWTVAQLTAAIRGSAIPVKGCSAVLCGTGIVNAARAVSINNFLTRTKAPSISGKFKVGKTLKAKPGRWWPKVKVSYRWLRNGAPISKATKSKYKLTKKDKSRWVTVQITVTGPAGFASQVEVPKSHKVKR